MRIGISIVGGFVLGAISYLTTVAELTIQVSDDLILGPWEVFNVISAALFGPIGALVTELGLDVSAYIHLIQGAFPAPQDAYFMMGNYVAHMVALFAVAYGYRFMDGRMGMPRVLGGWFLLMVVYYVIGVPLSVLLHNAAVPGLGATYSAYFRDVRLEFVLVTVITSLILLALPERFRRPQWYMSKQSLDRSGKTPNE